MALRSKGFSIPDYSENIDVTHSCGKGKCSETNPKPCISLQCLSLGKHSDNMNQQRCKPVVECDNCGLLTKACTHTPTCTSQLTFKLIDQKKVKQIIIYYEDGTSETVIPKQ